MSTELFVGGSSAVTVEMFEVCDFCREKKLVNRIYLGQPKCKHEHEFIFVCSRCSELAGKVSGSGSPRDVVWFVLVIAAAFAAGWLVR